MTAKIHRLGDIHKRHEVAELLQRAIAELRSGDDIPSLRRALDDIEQAEISAHSLWEHMEERQ